jgi:peptidoglycan hydrolase FlgJ
MISDTATYTDFQGFANMRREAREESPEAIKKTAKQFEALFVQMMLKSMRDTLPEDGMFNSKQQSMYQDMMDKQLSLNLSMGKGVGLADVIERQLTRESSNYHPPRDLVDYFNRPVMQSAKPVAQTSAMENPYTDVKMSSIDDGYWQKPEEFVNDVWPHAVKAGYELGVDPEVLIAQSALETGWGKYSRHFENGDNSYSLFGIKADSQWQGKRIFVSTLEFKEGTMQREQANFRAYDSIGDAFEDYVGFIQDNPRYQQALEKGYSPKAYAEELQKAGYATDPDYAAKIERIRSGKLLKTQVSELKNGHKVPLT